MLPILGIGVDILHVPRIAKILSGEKASRFVSRLLSEHEYEEWSNLQDHTRSVRFVAVRWAVKEAAYKALNPTFKPTWGQLTYSRPAHSKPLLLYKPSVATKESQMLYLHCSVSHDGDYVLASVLAGQQHAPEPENKLP